MWFVYNVYNVLWCFYIRYKIKWKTLAFVLCSCNISVIQIIPCTLIITTILGSLEILKFHQIFSNISYMCSLTKSCHFFMIFTIMLVLGHTTEASCANRWIDYSPFGPRLNMYTPLTYKYRKQGGWLTMWPISQSF